MKPICRPNDQALDLATAKGGFSTDMITDFVAATSNANYFALTAGLAHKTKNDTLAKQAASTYDMMTKAGWIDNDFNVFDGAQTENDCKLINKIRFSQNPGLLLTGAAYMFQQVCSLFPRPSPFFLCVLLLPSLFHQLVFSVLPKLTVDVLRFRPTATRPGRSASTACSTAPSSSSSPTASPRRSRARAAASATST